MPQTIALVVSDLHLTLKRPACRADKDWMEVQASYLAQVREMGNSLPILCAGDIFDKWSVTPELIHFALEHLPDQMICVAGQHDLPNHQLEEMNRSAYGVLKRAKKIIDISDGSWGDRQTFVARGFGWNVPLNDGHVRQINSSTLKVALIHRYCWMEGKGYPGAPEEAKYFRYLEPLEGFTTLIFGDNHQPFQQRQKHQFLYNCGGFIIRKSDEIGKLRPSVGFLQLDGSIKRQYLEASQDQFQLVMPENDSPFDVKEFLRQLDALGEHGLDFREAVMQEIKKGSVTKSVAKIILTAIDTKE
jgi:DNA repair exonuclease SbcCD nuclease subunit